MLTFNQLRTLRYSGDGSPTAAIVTNSSLEPQTLRHTPNGAPWYGVAATVPPVEVSLTTGNVDITLLNNGVSTQVSVLSVTGLVVIDGVNLEVSTDLPVSLTTGNVDISLTQPLYISTASSVTLFPGNVDINGIAVIIADITDKRLRTIPSTIILTTELTKPIIFRNPTITSTVSNTSSISYQVKFKKPPIA